jgi:hypothetical protein
MDHPDTIQAAARLASTYRRQDRLNEAVGLLAPAVELGPKVLGQQHPKTQANVRDLVGLYKKMGLQGEVEEARKLLRS